MGNVCRKKPVYAGRTWHEMLANVLATTYERTSGYMCVHWIHFAWLNIRGVSAFIFRQGQQWNTICILKDQQLSRGDTSRVRSRLEISFAAFRDLTRWDWTDSTIRSLLTPGFHHMAIVDHAHWTRCVHTSCKTKGSHNTFISLNQPISHMCLPHGCLERLCEFVFLKSNVGNN